MWIKFAAFLLGVAIIAVLTDSFWASCDTQYRICTAVCDVRHTDSDLKKAGCKARCTSDKVACVSREFLEKNGAR
jgi:hypothetical protein